jgi:Fe2+ transport system protein FeoA
MKRTGKGDLMGNEMSLADMRSGQAGTIAVIDGGYGMVRKLEGLGIINGKHIRKLSTQLMRGPVIVQVGRTQVGIGFGMARRIIVRVAEVK